MTLTLDPLLPRFFTILLLIFTVSALFLRFKQPILIAYLLTGVALGPHGLNFIENNDSIALLGNVGVVLLLFFLGMEISLYRLLAHWKVSIGGTTLQVAGSVALVFLFGSWLGWGLSRIILLGFVISLSSTSIILRLLKHAKRLDSDIGHDVIGISLTQDLAVVPMLIILGFFNGEASHTSLIIKQGLGTLCILCIILYLHKHKVIKLPFGKFISQDEDMQLITALCICFSISLLTAYLGLSTAVGAFIAGLIVRSAKETYWVKKRLEPFRIFLMALFFISIGMMIDFKFINIHKFELITLTLVALVANTFINAFILKLLGRTTRESLFGGALLAQISEFSFVLASVGLQANIISEFSYNMTIALISITLLVSPWWVALFNDKSRNSK